ncbi:hypothetical protein ABBQ38_013929 [Trebouxia sp. C0009 RCD-2024]
MAWDLYVRILRDRGLGRRRRGVRLQEVSDSGGGAAGSAAEAVVSLRAGAVAGTAELYRRCIVHSRTLDV